MRRTIFSLVMLLLAVVVLAFLQSCERIGEFFQNATGSMVALATLAAVIVALFRDEIHEWLHPIKMSLIVPRRRDHHMAPRPLFIVEHCGQEDSKTHEVAYRYHLAVKNEAHGRVVKDCQVWLVGIENRQSEGDEYRAHAQFGAPRLMEWTPADYSKELRTFKGEQSFDFGDRCLRDGSFVLKCYKDKPHGLQTRYGMSEWWRFSFIVRASNYVSDKELRVVLPPFDLEGFRNAAGQDGRQGMVLSENVVTTFLTPDVES